jgi:hypothetical protein
VQLFKPYGLQKCALLKLTYVYSNNWVSGWLLFNK